MPDIHHQTVIEWLASVHAAEKCLCGLEHSITLASKQLRETYGLVAVEVEALRLMALATCHLCRQVRFVMLDRSEMRSPRANNLETVDRIVSLVSDLQVDLAECINEVRDSSSGFHLEAEIAANEGLHLLALANCHFARFIMLHNGEQ